MGARIELEAVYRQHAENVARWAARLTGRPGDAWDITHEVFSVVQRRLGGLSAREGTLSTWLFRITANVVRSHRRRERLRSWFFVESEETSDEIAAGALDPEARAIANGDARLVYHVLERLSEVDRSLILLFELEGYAGEQVAEMLGLKPSVIWVRLRRGRAAETLASVREYRDRFPEGVLALEATSTEVRAHRALGKLEEALAALDRVAPSRSPRSSSAPRARSTTSWSRRRRLAPCPRAPSAATS